MAISKEDVASCLSAVVVIEGSPLTDSVPIVVIVVAAITPLGSLKGSLYVPEVENEEVTTFAFHSSGIGGTLCIQRDVSCEKSLAN
jgi:hypothetical protein